MMSLAQFNHTPKEHTARLERTDLLAAVEKAILAANVRLTAGKDGIEIIGTDLNVEIAAMAPGYVDKDFDVTLPAHRLRDVLKGAKDIPEIILTAQPAPGQHIEWNFALAAQARTIVPPTPATRISAGVRCRFGDLTVDLPRTC